MTSLAELLIENSIKSAMLAGIVTLFALLPRVRNLVNLQHSLWGLVLVAMIVPSMIEIPLISMSPFEQSAEVLHQAPRIGNGVTIANQVELDDSQNSVSIALSRVGGETNWLNLLVTAACFGGSACLISIAVRRVLLLRRTIRLARFDDVRLSSLAEVATNQLGIRRPVRVAIVQSTTSPFIWVGPRAIHIVIAESLRESLSDRRLLCIMLHELAHYQRRDHWSNTVGFLVLALCWWNPVSWIAVRRMRALQEYCCDAIAIAKSQASRREYAECLYQITRFIESKNTCLPASACELFGRTSIEERFKMIASSTVGFESTRTSLLMIFVLSALLPCTVAFSQSNGKAVQTEPTQREKDEAESKQWREVVEKFNRFAMEGNWLKAEQLANETASKFGHEDAAVQHMLLTSINGVRQSQGLAPILVAKLVMDPKADEIPRLVMYPLKDFLPSNAPDKGKSVEILTQCIVASIANVGSDRPDAKVHYDTVNHALIVLASKPQQNLAAEIVKRVGQKPK